MSGKAATKPSNKPSSGDDILVGTKVADIIHALAGNDRVSGGDGNDRIYGEEGQDTLNGDGGNDDLRGGDGNDQLNGGIGNDALNGGAGADLLSGGAGADHFDYGAFSDSAGAAVDRITDYSLAAGDDLVFGALDANANVEGLQVWNYVQALGDYTGANGQATLSFDAATNTTTLNLYNNDNDSNADFTVVFTGQYGAGDIQITVVDLLGGDPNIHGIIW